MKIQNLLSRPKVEEEKLEEILTLHDNQFFRLIGSVNANRFTYDFDDRDFDSGFANQNTLDAIHDQNPNLSKNEIVALIKHLNTLNGSEGRVKSVQSVGDTEYAISTISIQKS